MFTNSFNPTQFDPSKLDPKLMMELSQIIQTLPMDKIMKMQGLMQSMMAGKNVQKEMEEFEKSLPADFRIRMATLMAGNPGQFTAAMSGSAPQADIEVQATPVQSNGTKVTDGTAGQNSANMNLKEARLTILQAVADGTLTPEEAERLL